MQWHSDFQIFQSHQNPFFNEIFLRAPLAKQNKELLRLKTNWGPKAYPHILLSSYNPLGNSKAPRWKDLRILQSIARKLLYPLSLLPTYPCPSIWLSGEPVPKVEQPYYPNTWKILYSSNSHDR